MDTVRRPASRFLIARSLPFLLEQNSPQASESQFPNLHRTRRAVLARFASQSVPAFVPRSSCVSQLSLCWLNFSCTHFESKAQDHGEGCGKRKARNDAF